MQEMGLRTNWCAAPFLVGENLHLERGDGQQSLYRQLEGDSGRPGDSDCHRGYGWNRACQNLYHGGTSRR
jgi:hypothetical protein